MKKCDHKANSASAASEAGRYRHARNLSAAGIRHVGENIWPVDASAYSADKDMIGT
jgi:hypothetical protein